MKIAKLHLLREDGRALCIGRKPAKQGDEFADPCGRCENVRQREADKAKRRERREADAKQRAADLEAGKLVQLASGNYALRYTLNGKVIEESIGTGDERKARILAPLCMAQIRRTGRSLNKAPKCLADKL